MNLICRLRRHKLPRQIDTSHPMILRVRGDRAEYGIAYPIPCERCGHEVAPTDKDYPMIIPQEPRE